MKQVNVTALRRNLPGYLAMVGRGERVCVTHRGRVIAEISPSSSANDSTDPARARLRGSLVRYDSPFGPSLSPDEWEMNQ